MNIRDTETFRVTSYHNGLAFVLAHKGAMRDVLFQGEDALRFEAELDAMETAFPDKSTDAVLASIWSDYEAVSAEIC